MLNILSQLSESPVGGVDISYVSTSLEALGSRCRSSRHQIPSYLLQLLFNIGFQTQSLRLAEFIETCLDKDPNSLDSLASYLPSCDIIWDTDEFTPFEGRILGRLAPHCAHLCTRLVRKLSSCTADLDSLANVLQLIKSIASNANDSSSLLALKNASVRSLSRWQSRIERTLQDEGIKEVDGSLLEDFLSLVDDLDADKWLGILCKYDVETLIPRAIGAIEAVFRRESSAYHRRLPGWLVRTMSRLTRRFAEDKKLSEETIKAVQELGSILQYFR